MEMELDYAFTPTYLKSSLLNYIDFFPKWYFQNKWKKMGMTQNEFGKKTY